MLLGINEKSFVTYLNKKHILFYSDQQSARLLKVSYPPNATLTLGHGLDPKDIKEGADVYFECHLSANPWVSITFLIIIFSNISCDEKASSHCTSKNTQN